MNTNDPTPAPVPTPEGVKIHFAHELLAELEQTKAKLAEAVKDRERLDWLENQGQLIARQYRDGWHFDASNGAWVCVNATTLRVAIDAAWKAGGAP